MIYFKNHFIVKYITLILFVFLLIGCKTKVKYVESIENVDYIDLSFIVLENNKTKFSARMLDKYETNSTMKDFLNLFVVQNFEKAIDDILIFSKDDSLMILSVNDTILCRIYLSEGIFYYTRNTYCNLSNLNHTFIYDDQLRLLDSTGKIFYLNFSVKIKTEYKVEDFIAIACAENQFKVEQIVKTEIRQKIRELTKNIKSTFELSTNAFEKNIFDQLEFDNFEVIDFKILLE